MDDVTSADPIPDAHASGPPRMVPAAEASAEEIAAVMAGGGAVVLPTETVYGLAIAAGHASALGRAYALKGRPREMNLPVVVGSVDQVEKLGLGANDRVRRLADQFWPGPLTLILGFRAGGRRPAWLDGRDEVAVRFPEPSLLREIAIAGGPYLMTSANRHGEPSAIRALAAARSLMGRVEMVVDAGALSPVPSTILNLRASPPCIERVGAISPDRLEAALDAGRLETRDPR